MSVFSLNLLKNEVLSLRVEKKQLALTGYVHFRVGSTLFYEHLSYENNEAEKSKN